MDSFLDRLGLLLLVVAVHLDRQLLQKVYQLAIGVSLISYQAETVLLLGQETNWWIMTLTVI